MKTALNRKRRRTIPYIFGYDRLVELLWQLLDDADPRLARMSTAWRMTARSSPRFMPVPLTTA